MYFLVTVHMHCTMSASQLVRRSFGIKSHSKQKCFYDLCISFCKQLICRDLTFFSNRISQKFLI